MALGAPGPAVRGGRARPGKVRPPRPCRGSLSPVGQRGHCGYLRRAREGSFRPPGCLRRAPRSGALPGAGSGSRASRLAAREVPGPEGGRRSSPSTREASISLARSAPSSGRACPIVLVENERLLEGYTADRRTDVPVLARFEIGGDSRSALGLSPGNASRRVRQRGIGPRARPRTDDFRRDFQARGDGLELIDLVGSPDGRAADAHRRLCRRTRSSSYGAIRVDGAGRSFIPREALRH